MAERYHFCHNDFYSQAFVSSYAAIMRAEPGWQQALESYGVIIAFVPAQGPLGAALGYASGWRKIYGDAAAAVFVRREDISPAPESDK